MRIFFALALLTAPSLCRSQGFSYVQEVAKSSGTVNTIAVSSQPAIDIAATAVNGKLNGAYAIEVYNLSGNANTINCGYDSNVSTTSTSSFYGREIAAGTGMVWHVLQGVVKVWCMSQSTSGSTRATITQVR